MVEAVTWASGRTFSKKDPTSRMKERGAGDDAPVGFIKHKPKLSLLVQQKLYPGGVYNAQVVVEARREVTIDWLKVRLDGEERGTIGTGQSQRTYRRRFVGVGATLCERRTFQAERKEFRFRFEIPENAPPSYRGRRCTSEYIATVRASIPWWPDARAAFDVFVSLPAGESITAEPSLFSSDPAGPTAREPHVEGSLASAVIDPGGVVEGALALNNVEWNAYTSIDVGLVGIEQVSFKGQTSSKTEALRYGLEIPIESPKDGESIPFSFRVPSTLPPSHGSLIWNLSWAFEVRVRVKWRSDVWFRVPVTVVPAATSHDGPHHVFREPPSVGSERVEKIWRVVAREMLLTYETGALYGRIGEVEYEIRREHRGRLGVFLVARFAYPKLHLDLVIEPTRSLLGGWGEQVTIDKKLWDSRHTLRGRDPSQLVDIGGRLGWVLKLFHAARVNDAEAFVEQRGSGQGRQKLLEFASAVRAFAGVFDEARQAIPPPRTMVIGLELWQDFAAQLGGSLETARMAVRGHYQAMPVEVRTDWTAGGEPERTFIQLRPNVFIAADNEVHLSATDGPLSPEANQVASFARPIVEALVKDAHGFDLAGDEVSLLLPAPFVDPRPLLERLALMAQLCELVRAGKGPFR